MIFNKTNEIKNYIKSLLDMRNQVDNAIEIINTYLNDYNDQIDDELLNLVRGNTSFSNEKVFYFAILKLLNIDRNDSYLKKLEKNLKLNVIKELDVEKYKNNPFMKNIITKEIKNNNWKMEYQYYLPYMGFLYLDTIVDESNYFSEFTPIGYFKEQFKYLSIIENDTTWMLISPHEIETMEESIKNASGNVVVYGLGLGYYPYMISLKENVNKIVIIEKDKNVIDIFEKYILPQFENKQKIEILCEDAIKFTKEKLPKLSYNYAFFDIYHNVEDGLIPYIEMLKLEKFNKHITFSYWIEKSLITAIRRCLITLIDEEYNGAQDNNYKTAKNDFDKIINDLHFKLKNRKINSSKDIIALLKDENIKKIYK